MFSSTTNPNLFPNLSASNYHYHLFSPPPFLGSDATDFFLHHSDLLMADTLFGMVQVSNKSPVIRNQEASTEPINEQKFGTNIGTKLTKAKKQKHSKIFTAQGLRDRRVRLSIETARKFFDLQDMLGFEKASKTIDWLLKNSKTEIKDLMNNRVMKAESPSTLLSTSTTAPAGCEVVSGNHEAGTKMMMMMMKKLIKGKKVKSMKDRVVLYDRYLASREARARARERARERTREKKMLRSDQLKGSPISSDEQKISEYSFKFVQTLEGACHI